MYVLGVIHQIQYVDLLQQERGLAVLVARVALVGIVVWKVFPVTKD